MTPPSIRRIPWEGWVFAALVAVELLGVVTHSMWRDEMQQWNIVNASRTLPDLIQNLRFEGHPWLWYLLIWPLSKVSAEPLALQLFHFALALSTAFLVMLKAPFRRSTRLLLVAGYYLSFEYVVIVRSYVLAPLIAFAWCAWGARTAERPVRSAVLLGLLANTSVYGTMLALVLAVGEVFDLIRPEASSGPSAPERARALLRFSSVFAALTVLALTAMAMAREGGIYWNVDTGYRLDPAGLAESFSRVVQSLLPLPLPKVLFWNTSALWWAEAPFLSAAVAVALLAGVFSILLGCRRALVLFGLLVLGVLLFNVVVFPGTMRHNGILFVGFVALIWHRHPGPAGEGGGPVPRRLLTGLLAGGVAASAVATAVTLSHPFSMGESVARELRTRGLDRYPIVAQPDYIGVPVAGYLGRPVHFASTGGAGTFVPWSAGVRRWGLRPEDGFSFARWLAAEGGVPVVLLVNERSDMPSLVPLFEATGSVVGDEQYAVYGIAPPAERP